VVDKDFGDRLQTLVGFGPVWVVDTEANRKAAESHWHENPGPKQEEVTTFKCLEQDSASEICQSVGPADLDNRKKSI